jgi:hypothetical protein
VPYRVLAATPRLTDGARARLNRSARVEAHDGSPTAERGSREHAHHLDALLARALEGPASHLVTLDLDSFPVRDAWHDHLVGAAPTGIAAILRAENLDTVLPHPSCTFLPRDFAAAHPFSFSPDTDGTPGFRGFLRSTGQRADTGIRLARILHEAAVPWHRMLRSNRRDVHPLIAGIYDDTVFHLGAGARESLFRRDRAGSAVHRLTRPVERVPVPAWARASKRRVLDGLRRPTERRMVAANDDAATLARERLRTDPDAFVEWLRGG